MSDPILVAAECALVWSLGWRQRRRIWRTMDWLSRALPGVARLHAPIPETDLREVTERD